MPLPVNMEALQLNGTNQYVAVPDAPAIRSASFTISGWFIFLGGAGSQVLFCKSCQSVAASFASWMVYFANNNLVIQFGNQFSAPYVFNPGNTLHHIVLTYDGRNAVLYVDGTMVIAPLPIMNAPAFDGNPLMIGANLNNMVAAGFSNFFNGAVYDVRLYSVALGAGGVAQGAPAPPGTQIGQLYNAGSPWFGDATVAGGNLVGWWKLNEGAGNAANDSSANANNGAVNNPCWNVPPPNFWIGQNQTYPNTFTAAQPFTLTGTCSPLFLYNEMTGSGTYGNAGIPACANQPPQTSGNWAIAICNAPTPMGVRFTATVVTSPYGGSITKVFPLATTPTQLS